MLGTDLVKLCERRGLNPKALDLPEFDITDTGQLAAAVESSDIIINCAAYTNVDGAETESELAHKINAEAVGRLGELAAKAGTYVIHISTDFVFDGKTETSYKETDTPNPIGEYGASKLAGERLLADSGAQACVLRVQWTYGAYGENFITKILARARAGGPLTVVDNEKGSPTATTEASKAICRLLPQRPTGLYHFAAAGYASRFEVARFILVKTGIECDLKPCKAADWPSPAARPLNSRFDCSKIAALLNEPLRPWQDPLEEFLGIL